MPIEIPAAITVPIVKRLSAPAPVAIINGNTPSTIAAVVIKIGRSRITAAFSIASLKVFLRFVADWRNARLKYRVLLIKPIKVTKPISL